MRRIAKNGFAVRPYSGQSHLPIVRTIGQSLVRRQSERVLEWKRGAPPELSSTVMTACPRYLDLRTERAQKIELPSPLGQTQLSQPRRRESGWLPPIEPTYRVPK